MNNLDDNTIKVEIIITSEECDIATCEICSRKLNHEYDRICDPCYLEFQRHQRKSVWLVLIAVALFFYILGVM